MAPHPYRTQAAIVAEPASDGFEERAVAIVLVIAGVLTLATGLGAPTANATELVLGIALLAIGVQTYRRSRIEPVV